MVVRILAAAPNDPTSSSAPLCPTILVQFCFSPLVSVAVSRTFPATRLFVLATMKKTLPFHDAHSNESFAIIHDDDLAVTVPSWITALYQPSIGLRAEMRSPTDPAVSLSQVASFSSGRYSWAAALAFLCTFHNSVKGRKDERKHYLLPWATCKASSMQS